MAKIKMTKKKTARMSTGPHPEDRVALVQNRVLRLENRCSMIDRQLEMVSHQLYRLRNANRQSQPPTRRQPSRVVKKQVTPDLDSLNKETVASTSSLDQEDVLKKEESSHLTENREILDQQPTPSELVYLSDTD